MNELKPATLPLDIESMLAIVPALRADEAGIFFKILLAIASQGNALTEQELYFALGKRLERGEKLSKKTCRILALLREKKHLTITEHEGQKLYSHQPTLAAIKNAHNISQIRSKAKSGKTKPPKGITLIEYLQTEHNIEIVDNDEDTYRLPQDWRPYFHKKRGEDADYADSATRFVRHYTSLDLPDAQTHSSQWERRWRNYVVQMERFHKRL